MNIKTLQAIINEQVIKKLDHRNLNTQVDFMNGKLASTENIAIAVWEILGPHIKKEGAELHCIKIAETENNFIEYFGKQ